MRLAWGMDEPQRALGGMGLARGCEQRRTERQVDIDEDAGRRLPPPPEPEAGPWTPLCAPRTKRRAPIPMFGSRHHRKPLGPVSSARPRRRAKYALDHGLTLDTELNMTDLGVSAYRGKNAHTGALGGFLKAVDAEGMSTRGQLPARLRTWTGCHALTSSQRRRLFLQLVGSGINLVTLTTGEAYSAERLPREPEAVIYGLWLELIRARRPGERAQGDS